MKHLWPSSLSASGYRWARRKCYTASSHRGFQAKTYWSSCRAGWNCLWIVPILRGTLLNHWCPSATSLRKSWSLLHLFAGYCAWSLKDKSWWWQLRFATVTHPSCIQGCQKETPKFWGTPFLLPKRASQYLVKGLGVDEAAALKGTCMPLPTSAFSSSMH